MNGKNNLLPKSRTLNCRGRLSVLDRPMVMGILNLTPDSFSDGGKFNSVDAALKRAEQMLEEGTDMLDLGAYSSRPGAEHISEEEELARLLPPLEAIRQRFPEAVISIDTFRAGVATQAMEAGAHIINDISGGELDTEIPLVAAHYSAPYICMHMRGTPQTMQQGLTETPCLPTVLDFFAQRVAELTQKGVHDVMIDPGFGFGKTLAQNYELVEGLGDLGIFGKPIVVGVSRKSMIWKRFGESAEQIRMGHLEVHDQLLRHGADILRVHDVKQAVQIVNSTS